MLPDQSLFVTQLLTLWAVLDPVGHLPLFMGATASLEARDRRRAAVIAVLLAFGILTAFGFVGQYLLHAMGISLLSFQIAGGIVLFLFAINMVLGEGHDASPPAPGGSVLTRERVMAIAIFPLSAPIIAGPGAMLSMVLLMDNNRFSLVEQFETIGALAVVLAALLVIFIGGGLVERVIGKGGTQLLRRIMGLLLCALAVNLILSALASWLNLPGI